ncbi:hypothetical protein RJ639_019838 [Escallonia herrerae]|uniref:Cyclin-dependent kinase inhibitor domain-containing protein n=1 Tax=Escallonia herrerae TaxID=1293975 RepID=A0AA88V8D1_9ASTE|nr:hypothetical protein RJ639_019838 [Escallonia herrerae]
MGKYMRKSKTTGELVALMEVTQQSSLGVKTRAKTLALQRLQKSAVAPPSAAPSGGSYLQLRSRRLEKPPIPLSNGDSKRQKTLLQSRSNPNSSPSSGASSRLGVGSVNSGGVKLDCLKKDGGCLNAGVEEEVQVKKGIINESVDVGIEASFGENMVEFEGRERSTRESTPCSLIRDPETVKTPGSTTRPSSSTDANTRMQNSTRRDIPTANEMDEFFADAEGQQQKQFIEKYNFDPVKDEPLPGRYQWVKVDR